VIHRAIYGSFERFIGILIEHFAGNFPVWIAPEQARLLPVAERHHAWCDEVAAKMRAADLRVDIDRSHGKLGAMIRDAQLAKIPYALVVGDKEVEARGVSPRKHGTGKDADLGLQPLDAFLAQIVKEAKSVLTQAVSQPLVGGRELRRNRTRRPPARCSRSVIHLQRERTFAARHHMDGCSPQRVSRSHHNDRGGASKDRELARFAMDSRLLPGIHAAAVVRCSRCSPVCSMHERADKALARKLRSRGACDQLKSPSIPDRTLARRPGAAGVLRQSSPRTRQRGGQ
jgi:hypothetical protein